MWKYECKRHLLYLLLAAAAGAVLFGITIDDNFIKEVTEMYEWLSLDAARQAFELRWLVGALVGAAIVNGLLLVRYAINHFQISPYFLLLLLIVTPIFRFLLIVGLLLLIPSLIVCLYGMLTVRNAAAKNFRTLPNGDGNEVERIYRLHHTYVEDVVPLAVKCRKESDRWTLIYFLGLIALMCLLLIVKNLTLVMVVVVGYAFLSSLLFRMRAQSVVPINALLFDQCDPLAAASAILAFSRRGRRLNLKMHLLFAQCMLTLDDPQLAMDALVLMRRSRSNTSMELNYQMLLAEANYQLGDQGALERNLEAVRSTRVNIGAAGNLMLQEAIASIQNKLYLMNEHFDQCEAYYKQVLPQMKLRLQQVNARYFLGMIAFIQKDFDTAQEHFSFVAAQGNTTSYRGKAEKYLAMIERMEAKAAAQEEEA